MDKKIFRDLSYGMYVITTKKGEENIGLIANTVTQITSENPIISVSINKENYTSECIKQNKKFGISVISEETNPEVISKFGFYSSKDIDKFENFNCEEINEIPIVKENMCGYLICELIETVDCQTHNVFIAKVLDAKKENEYEPMTYSYYHRVIKGKAPKKAPTYIDETETKNEENVEMYECIVCGYIHKGDMPEDFKCPVCGVDKTMFKKIEK